MIPSHRSQLMRALRECGTLLELREALVEVICQMPTDRDTVPCGPPEYPGELLDAAPPTPLTLRAPAMPDFGGVR